MISPFGLDFLLDPESTYEDFLIAGDWWEENGWEDESFFFRILAKWRRRPTRHGLFHRLPSYGPAGSAPTGHHRQHYLPTEFFPGDGRLPVSLSGDIGADANWFVGGYDRFAVSLGYTPHALFHCLDCSSPGPPDWSFFWDADDAAIWPGNQKDAEALRELGRRRYTPILDRQSFPAWKYFWLSWGQPNGTPPQLPLTFYMPEEWSIIREGQRFCSPSMPLSECYHWYLRRYHERHKPTLLAMETPDAAADPA